MQTDKIEAQVPEWLRQEICSKQTIKQKRQAIEDAIETDDGFVAWALLALFDLQTPGEKERMEIMRCDGLGFCKWDGKSFMRMAAGFIKRGSLSTSDLLTCRQTNLKGRTWLGKYGGQLIGLIASASCFDRIPRGFKKRLEDRDAPREKAA